METSHLYVVTLTAVFLIACGTAAAQEHARIDAVVYDLKIGENRYDGFCLVTLESNSTPEDMTFSTDSDVELLTEGLSLVKEEEVIHIKGLDTFKTDTQRRIILRLRGRVYNHTMDVPFLLFPYEVDNTLIAISAPNKKFVWNIGSATFPLENDDAERVLAMDDFREEDLPKLNSEYLNLRSASTKTLEIPEYRLYMGAMGPGEYPQIGFWAGTVYDYYAWQTIIAAILSIVFLSAVYLFTKKRKTKQQEETQETLPQEEQEAIPNEDKIRWEENLSKLEGDEHTVYKEIMDAGGEMLQKKICEKTGCSSVKTTRILNRLEQKDLIERKSYGVTNNVVLQ